LFASDIHTGYGETSNI